MFQCRACVWRCMRAIAGDAYNPRQILSAGALIPTRRVKTSLRHASTAIATSAEDDLVQGKQPIQPPEDANSPNKSKKLSSGVPERQLGIELQYLPDRVKLAEHVHYTLRCEQPEKALDLCRLASKEHDAVVSWNHCINWYMQRGKYDDALKVYNEMKKRAHFPDSYTYSLILSGFSKSVEPGEPVKAANVAKALSVYYSMDSPTSRVKPNIIHTNNVLKVCKEGLDMDAIWSVVSGLAETGARAPNEMTYSILLDAIRMGAFGKEGMSIQLQALPMARAKAIHDGRAVWRDVVKKWRNGQIKIDARLVAAMGSLLRMSTSIQDWDDVLNLVQQTMNIPRQLPVLGSPDRHIEHVPQDNDLRVAEPVLEEAEDGYAETPTATAFLPVNPPGGSAALSFVQPTRATLSMLVETCTLLRAPKAARAYWELLTAPDRPYAIQPERGDYHTLMKLYGKNRASAQVVTVLREMVKAKVEPAYNTFRIAIGVCERDIKNRHNLQNARAIIDIMESTLADPDVPTLDKYIKLVLASSDSAEIIFTLERLDSIIHNLRSRITYGSVQFGKSPHQHMLERGEALDFFQSLVGVMDVVRKRELIPAEQSTSWAGRRKQLVHFIEQANRNLKATRERLEEDTGERMPHPKMLSPRRGMHMSQAEYGLRLYRYKRRVESVEKKAERERLGLDGTKRQGRLEDTKQERAEPWVQRMEKLERSRVEQFKEQDQDQYTVWMKEDRKLKRGRAESTKAKSSSRTDKETAISRPEKEQETPQAEQQEERERRRVQGLFNWDVRNARPDIPTRGQIIDMQNKRGWEFGSKRKEKTQPREDDDIPFRRQQGESGGMREQKYGLGGEQSDGFADSPMDLHER